MSRSHRAGSSLRGTGLFPRRGLSIWNHPVSEPTLPSSPGASPLVDRLNEWDPNPARLARPPEPGSQPKPEPEN